MECKENMRYLYERVNSSLQPLGITQLFYNCQPETQASVVTLATKIINHGLQANIAVPTTESRIRVITRDAHFTDVNKPLPLHGTS